MALVVYAWRSVEIQSSGVVEVVDVPRRLVFISDVIKVVGREVGAILKGDVGGPFFIDFDLLSKHVDVNSVDIAFFV